MIRLTESDPFAWPEDTRIADLRADLATATARLADIAALCAKYRGKDGRVPCSLLEAAMKGTP